MLAVVTGAPCPVSVEGRPAAWETPIRVPAGATLEAGTAVRGLRTYLAFAAQAAPGTPVRLLPTTL